MIVERHHDRGGEPISASTFMKRAKASTTKLPSKVTNRAGRQPGQQDEATAMTSRAIAQPD